MYLKNIYIQKINKYMYSKTSYELFEKILKWLQTWKAFAQWMAPSPENKGFDWNSLAECTDTVLKFGNIEQYSYRYHKPLKPKTMQQKEKGIITCTHMCMDWRMD